MFKGYCQRSNPYCSAQPSLHSLYASIPKLQASCLLCTCINSTNQLRRCAIKHQARSHIMYYSIHLSQTSTLEHTNTSIPFTPSRKTQQPEATNSRHGEGGLDGSIHTAGPTRSRLARFEHGENPT